MFPLLDKLFETAILIAKGGGNMSTTSGNSVADYRVVHEVCDICDGAGGLTERWQLEKYACESFISKKDLWLMYYQMLKNDRIICPECQGRGRVERWICPTLTG